MIGKRFSSEIFGIIKADEITDVLFGEVGLPCRQENVDRGSLAYSATGRPNLAVVRSNKFHRQRQTNTSAFMFASRGAINLCKPIKYSTQLVSFETHTGIYDS